MRAPNYAVAAVLYACAWAFAATIWTPARADDAPFNWTGFYVGAHTGAAMDYNDFSNPYGATLFGDEVRSPGPFIGGHGGYNYQFAQTVLGIDIAASWANLTGVGTCMQPAHSVPGMPGGFIGGAFGGTCQAQVDAFGTIAAKAGYVSGAQDRILIYGKGGLAWMHNDVTAAQNNALGGAGPETLSSDTKYWQWGWMLGGGLEYALTNRWSLGFEYDYLRFGEHQIATPRTTVIGGDPGLLGAISMDGRPADLSQDLHVAKLSVNYALEDRGAVADSYDAESQRSRMPFRRQGLPSRWAGDSSMDGRASRRISATKTRRCRQTTHASSMILVARTAWSFTAASIRRGTSCSRVSLVSVAVTTVGTLTRIGASRVLGPACGRIASANPTPIPRSIILRSI